MRDFRMPVPNSPDPASTAKIVEERKTTTEFDDYLSWVVLVRVSEIHLLHPTKRAQALQRIKEEVRRIVDVRLIDCICSNDPLHNYDLVARPMHYVREDTVQRRVRKLVELA